MSFFEIYG
ncbi:hypothetical protein CGLO_14321 [Colletotrichum gloeosporioides Cg-14]|uniref:Uncharacterized protein n=1 Tax=Colletotrichum gloeosporioides (strain Cg-14) TaxID=1237896 RepID=T0K468_COLGC|nr:hypothetical protein CGLO_14321 [Colletotrichum gloeosporioides Cg-14]